MTIFLYQGLTRNPEIGNIPVWVLSSSWRMGKLRTPNWAWIFLIICHWILQNFRVIAFTVSELLKENQEREKITLTHPLPAPTYKHTHTHRHKLTHTHTHTQIRIKTSKRGTEERTEPFKDNKNLISVWPSSGRTVQLPKTKDITDEKNCHPITCLNTTYKLLTGLLGKYMSED